MELKTILQAGGVSSIGVAFIYLLIDKVIEKSEQLSAELLFIILIVVFIFLFILAFKMLNNDNQKSTELKNNSFDNITNSTIEAKNTTIDNSMKDIKDSNIKLQ